MADVFIYDALRTPRGRGKAGKGGLSSIHPQELLAQTLNHMAERKKLDKSLVEDVAVGCVTQVKEQGACIARNALIAAQWPEDVTGFTINRFCGSGLEAVNCDRRRRSARASSTPASAAASSRCRACRWARDGAMLDGHNEKLRKRLFLVPQGISADLIATREGFTRDDVDKFALASQQKAARAIEGEALRELAVRGQERRRLGRRSTRDEHPRADTTLEALGGLKPAFVADGRDADGPERRDARPARAQALPRHARRSTTSTPPATRRASSTARRPCCMGSAEWGKKAGLKPRARIRAMATAGAEPVIMLTAPAPASEKALKKAGMHGQGHRPVGDQRGVRGGAAADGARARHRPRARSTSTAARSRSVTRSARPARSCSAPRSTSSSARTSRPR